MLGTQERSGMQGKDLSDVEQPDLGEGVPACGRGGLDGL